jgi:pimeloyl-ACP methyl ester carboxylesterase
MTAAGGVRGAVLVAHGGTEVSADPVTPLDPAVLRMVPLALAIRHGLRGSGIAVSRPRYRVRGWNGDLASPVQDLRAVIDETVARFGAIPVVLIGHSMGARAAFRVAGHPAVTAVAGLAPWLPPEEPVEQLAGRRVLLAHGTADRITSPAETWAYAERARSVTEVATIEVRDGEHTMLRRGALWHRLAVEFSRLALGLPAAGPTEVAAAFRDAAGGRHLALATARRETGGLLSGGARQAFAANGTRTVIVSGNQRAPPGCCGAPQTVCRYLIGGPNPSRASSAGNP